MVVGSVELADTSFLLVLVLTIEPAGARVLDGRGGLNDQHACGVTEQFIGLVPNDYRKVIGSSFPSRISFNSTFIVCNHLQPSCRSVMDSNV